MTRRVLLYVCGLVAVGIHSVVQVDLWLVCTHLCTRWRGVDDVILEIKFDVLQSKQNLSGAWPCIPIFGLLHHARRLQTTQAT